MPRPIHVINLSARAALERRVPFTELQKVAGLKLETRGNQHVKRGNNVLRNRDGALVTIYPNGTVWVTGAKTLQEASSRVAWLRSELSMAGLPTVSEPDVRNLVLQSKVDLVGDLLATYRALSAVSDCVYDPEEFPAMRIKAPHCAILLWANSKVTMAGAKSIGEALSDLDWLEGVAHAAGCHGTGALADIQVA